MEEHTITTHIESVTPTLTGAERSEMWQVVSAGLPVPSPVVVTPSSFLFTLTHYKPMTALILTLLLIAGGGGTAMASDASRPGDLLYPLERAIENTRLSLTASPEGREALTRTLTEERLEELREIIDEETVVAPSNITDDSFSLVGGKNSSSTIMLEIEADVFTDTTVIKVELNDKVFYFETDVQTREGVIAVLKEKFPTLTSEALETALSLEVEDRASRPKDKGIVSLSERGQSRVGVAMDAILSFLDTTTEAGDTSRDEALSALMNEVDTAVRVTHDSEEVRVDSRDHRYEIRLRDNGDSRIEVRNGDTRVRIEEKDGEVRVRTKNDDSNDVSESSDNVSVSRPSDDMTLEVEADVFTDTTLVTLEWRGEKVTFSTSARTREGVITAVLQKFPVLTRESVEAVLSFEVEDRASRPDDSVNDTISDTSSDDDGDDDEEDDRGGSGSGSRDDDEDEDDDDNGGRHGGDDDDDDSDNDDSDDDDE